MAPTKDAAPDNETAVQEEGSTGNPFDEEMEPTMSQLEHQDALAAKDHLIALLKSENAELRHRVAFLESELLTVQSQRKEASGTQVRLPAAVLASEELISAGGAHSVDGSSSSISRISNLDYTRIGNNALIRGQNRFFSSETEQNAILGQVRHRRFTLSQEKRIARASSSNAPHSARRARKSSRAHDSARRNDAADLSMSSRGSGGSHESPLYAQPSGNDGQDEEEHKEDLAQTEANPDEGAPKLCTSKRLRKEHALSALDFTDAKVPVHQLPRGGIYVQTSSGPIQFGIPPESIKDSMKLGLEVPVHYVVPKERFNLKLGINMCEVEFPAYFNFFLRQCSVNLVATPEVETVVRKVIDETLEGPNSKFLYVDEEYPENSEPTGRFSFAARPDHVKEINFFKEPRDGREISTNSLVQFTHFLPASSQLSHLTEAAKLVVEALVCKRSTSAHDSDAMAGSNSEGTTCCEVGDKVSSSLHDPEDLQVLVAVLGQNVEIIDCGEEYVIVDKGEVVARVQSFLSAWAPAPQILDNSIPKAVTDPPQFGVTVLGSSHGFDPNGSTSGFVLWMHKKGIMVDPPPNATEILQASGIIPSMITGIILTHCHADHDAGAFQKILKEGRITLITTQTIFSSFIRKYSIISGFAEPFLLRLFEHRIVKIGEHVHWGGGTLRFFYSLHALPCIGFEATVAGKTFAYSADTFYEPEGLRRLRDSGYLSPERCDALIGFPWHYDVVLHEAGIPPIHTPVTALQALPEPVRENLYIIHITEAKAEESGLRLARSGVENTIVINTPQHEHATSAAILQMLRGTDIFRHFTISQASDLLQLCQHCTYEPGEFICRAGEVGTHFFVILSGFCTVRLGDAAGEGQDLHEEYRLARAQSKLLDRESHSARSSGKLTPRSPSAASLTSNASAETFLSAFSESGYENQAKVLGAGDYLGELALLSEKSVRSADIVAITKLALIKLDQHAFRYLLDTTPGLQYRMERLSQIRCSLSWKAIGANSVFSRLRSTQRSQLQSIMQVQHVKRGTKLWRRDSPVTTAFLLASGQLEFLEMKEELQTPFRAGAFFCNISSMMTQFHQQQLGLESPTSSNDARRQSRSKKRVAKIVNSRVTLVARTDCDLYYIEADEILEFLDQNPGVFIQLIDSLVME